jgi:predicted transcriptional regulator
MKRPPLAPSELAIMDLLWEHERLTARDIREHLYAYSPKAQHGTVQRLLQRLEDKGYIKRDNSQFVHQFMASISRESYASGQLESLASKLTASSFAPLITQLVETSKLTGEDIDCIKKILDKHSRRGRKT